MSFPEISLLTLASVMILFRAWSGWRYGATMEMRYLLTIFFAMLVAMRYWQPWTQQLSSALTFEPRLLALGAFFALFGIGGLVAGYAVNLRGKFYQSVKANYIDQVLGLFAGLASGALLAASLVCVANIALPGRLASQPWLESFALVPQEIVSGVEDGMGVAPESAARTRFPVITMIEVNVEGDGRTAPEEGVTYLQEQAQISWK